MLRSLQNSYRRIHRVNLLRLFLSLEKFILSRWLGSSLIFFNPNVIRIMVGMKDGDVFSTCCEIQGRKIILGKIDRKQVLDNHHQAEAE